MKERKVIQVVQGINAVDGAGVHLTRVLSHSTVKGFDPFLMLDSFDSKNPQDYIKGFPMHPHRGIETVTYLVVVRQIKSTTIRHFILTGIAEKRSNKAYYKHLIRQIK